MKTRITLLCVALGACEPTPEITPSEDVKVTPPLEVAQEDSPEDHPGGPRSFMVKGIQDQETRALIYLKPSPTIGTGPLPEGSTLEALQYLRHTCWKHSEGLVCTACYSGPQGYSGYASLVCPPETGAECIYVHTLPEDMLHVYGVDPKYCDRKG